MKPIETPSVQQVLNTLAKAHGIKIELFSGWKVTDKDSNVYLVKRYSELNALVNNLVATDD